MIRSAHGQRIELHYRLSLRPFAPHLARGVALVMGCGPGPHNVLVRLDNGWRVVVPGGNCMEVSNGC